VKPIFDFSGASFAVQRKVKSSVVATRFSLLEVGSSEAFAKLPLMWPANYWSGVLIHCQGTPPLHLFPFAYHLKKSLGPTAPVALHFPSWQKKSRRWLRALEWTGYVDQPVGAIKFWYTWTLSDDQLKRKQIKKFSRQTCKSFLRSTCDLTTPQPKILEVLPTGSKIPFSDVGINLGCHPFVLLHQPKDGLQQQLQERLGKDR
jgi:hypothetical protein